MCVYVSFCFSGSPAVHPWAVVHLQDLLSPPCVSHHSQEQKGKSPHPVPYPPSSPPGKTNMGILPLWKSEKKSKTNCGICMAIPHQLFFRIQFVLNTFLWHFVGKNCIHHAIFSTQEGGRDME